MRERKYLKDLKKDIKIFAKQYTGKDTVEFVSKVICFFRKNLDLLNKSNFNRLYKECLLFKNKFSKHKIEFEHITIFADLYNNEHPDYAYKEEVIEHFLNYRKNIWKKENFDKNINNIE